MIYLIDSDALISANRKYYKMGHFSSFWTWLEKQFDLGVSISVTNVQSELLKGDSSDPLSLWAGKNGYYFLPTSGQSDQQNLTKITSYVNNRYQKGQPLTNFINGADIWLIAKALTLKNDGSYVTVVTNEQPAQKSTTKVKIPDVCRYFNIETMSFFDFIYNQNIKL